MGNLTIAATFVVILNTLMFLTQAAAVELNPNDGTIFYNCDGTIMDYVSAEGDCNTVQIIDTANISNQLPTTAKTISETTGFGFVDTFTSISAWFKEKTQLFLSLLSGPYEIVKAIPGIPNSFAFAIGGIWYVLSLIIIVAFIKGGG